MNENRNLENKLLEPVLYYKNLKGKNIRKILCDLFGNMLGVSTDNISLINEITNDFHNASLVIDDIEDNSLLRRNNTCAHIKYGIPLTLNAGYYSIFQSLERISFHFSDTTTKNMIMYLKYIHQGQGMDIYYSQNKFIPSLEEYEQMMIYKTGYAFIMNLELLMDKATNLIVKKKYEIIKRVLILFSLFFQIRDDYINLTDKEYWKEKGFCQDIDEEKISYIITYYYQNNKINMIEKMKNKSIDGKKEIVLLFHETGTFDFIYKKLLDLKQSILNEMNIEFLFDKLPFHKFQVEDLNLY